MFWKCILLICTFVAGVTSMVLGTEVVDSEQEEGIRKSLARAIDKKAIKRINVVACSEHKGLYEVSIEFDAAIENSPLNTRKYIFWQMRRCYKAIYLRKHPACNVTLSALAPAEKLGYLARKVKSGELLWKTSLTEEKARGVSWGGSYLSGLLSAYTNLPVRWQEHFIHPLLAAGRRKGQFGYE